MRKLEANYNIGFLDVSYEDNGPIRMEDNLYRTIKLLFKSKRGKPTTKQELKGMYIAMIKHIAGINIIETTRKRNVKGKEKERTYKVNYETIRRHLTLNQYKNPKQTDFLPIVYDLLKPQDLFVD